MKKPGLLVSLLLLVIASASVFPSRAATTITVKPSSLNGWIIAQEIQPTGTGSFVSGPPEVPLGSGSAELVVDGTGQVILSTGAYTATPLSQITRLEYSAYRSTPDAGNNLAISMQFDINYDTRGVGNANEGRLVFDPYLTPGLSGMILEDTWYTWDALQGRWYATKKPGSDSCPQSNPCDWSQVLALFPYAAIRNSSGYLIFKAGGPWSGGFSGNVDAFTIAINGQDTTYDFEPETACTTDCYVNAASGNDLFGGDTPDSAKRTIQAGIDAVDPGGTVHVAAGQYPEQVLVAKSAQLVGEDGSDQTFIQAPASTPAASDQDSAIVIISGSEVAAELTGFTIQGPGPAACGSLAYGVFVRDGATADIHDNQVLDIRDEPFSGCQNGVAIQVGRAALGTSGVAAITDNHISGYQKNGITVSNAGSSAVISGNTLTGAGPTTTIAQNGIQVSGEASAVISGNTVSGHSYTSGDWVSTGMLLYAADADTRGNSLSENQVGIYHLEGSGTHDSNSISASASGTGAPEFWGMVIDAPPPGLAPDPLEDDSLPVREESDPIEALDNPLQAVVVTNNTFTGDGGSTGYGLAAYTGFGSMDISLTARNNFFSGWGSALQIERCTVGCTGTGFSLLDLGLNSLSGNTTYGVYSEASEPAQAQANWWASPSGPTHAGNPPGAGEAASDGVDFEPWLCDGVDTDPALGFQPDEEQVCGGAPPQTEITGQPATPTNNPSAGFAFSGSDDFTPAEYLAFECQLDGDDWQACTGPASFSDLQDGNHTFQVRSVDPAGFTDPTPASHTWQIDTQGPSAENLIAGPDPVEAGGEVSFSATIDDSGLGGSPVASAAFSADSGLTWSPLDADDNIYNEETEEVSGSFTATGSAGELELCVRGIDTAGNTGSPACTGLAITGNPGSPPTASAGGPYTGKEGQSLLLQGSASDPDQDPLSILWTFTGKSGDKPGTTCSFGNKNALQTGFTCNDNGVFELTLTVSDGSHPPVSAKTTAAIANQPPRLIIAKPVQGSQFNTGTPVHLNAVFEEIAANDTVSCQVDWGVKRAALTPQLTGTCQGSHAYSQPGTYTILASASDDDAGVSSATVTVTIIEQPEAGSWVFMPVVIH